jgi:hypothetical protein
MGHECPEAGVQAVTLDGRLVFQLELSGRARPHLRRKIEPDVAWQHLDALGMALKYADPLSGQPRALPSAARWHAGTPLRFLHFPPRHLP